MYKFTMAVMKAATLTLVVAALMSYNFQGLAVMPVSFGSSAIACFFLTLLVALEHRSKMKNTPTSSMSFFDGQEAAGALALVSILPDSDLVYKGHRYEMFEELRQYDAWTS